LLLTFFPCSTAQRNWKSKSFLTHPTPELGPGPRPGVESEAELKKCLDKLLGNSNAQAEQWELILALVLLWHDHLDAAHESPKASPTQQVLSCTASCTAANRITKRRLLVSPRRQTSRIYRNRQSREQNLGSEGRRDLTGKLIPEGEWDAFAFINACETAAGTSTADGKRN